MVLVIYATLYTFQGQLQAQSSEVTPLYAQGMIMQRQELSMSSAYKAKDQYIKLLCSGVVLMALGVNLAVLIPAVLRGPGITEDQIQTSTCKACTQPIKLSL